LLQFIKAASKDYTGSSTDNNNRASEMDSPHCFFRYLFNKEIWSKETGQAPGMAKDALAGESW
jgi:hypothetical protein